MKSKPLLMAVMLGLSTVTVAQEIENIQLPDMGDSSETVISPAQEKELGDAFFRSLHRQLDISDDTEIQQYIQDLGHHLAMNSDTPSQAFHFFVVMDDAINAFAGPGGYIGMNAGLILMTEAESELASVMAHEIAHISQRHLYRAFEAASRLSIPAAVATLAAILLATQNPALGQAALVAIQAGSVQFQINFTRDNEQEADRVGMKNLAASNYDPRSMPTFFERLQQSTRFYGGHIPEFLRTHPVTVSRISDTRGRADQYPYRQYPDSHGYLLAQAKLRVLILKDKNKEKVFNYFRVREQQGTPLQRAVARYGTAWALLKQQKFSQAAKIFQALVNEYPNQFQYINALAKTALEAQAYQKSIKLYQQALQRFPNNHAIQIDTIQSLLKAGDAQTAQKQLLNLDNKTKKTPLYFELLSQSYAALKQMAQSHRYVAEYYYTIGLTNVAVVQTKLALKAQPMNFYLKAILEERLRFFMAEERQRKENE